MPISNSKIAEILYSIGEQLEMQNIPFKPRAYEKAAQAIADLEESLEDIYKAHGLKGLMSVPGVGASIAEKIEELLKTGNVKYYESLQKKRPVNLAELRRVEGLGPRSILTLYRKLGITDLNGLEKAARAGKIRKLEGFGAKSEEKIIRGIEFLKKSGGRAVLGLIMPQIKMIEERLKKLPEAEKVTVAGSTRRRRDTVGDIDILVVGRKAARIMDFFVKMPEVIQVIAKGETKSSVKTRAGLNVDIRVVPEESYGAALNYFTGSKAHNVALRQLAIKKGYKLNEYGLFSVASGRKVAGRTEEEIYAKLGLEYIEPELRENLGEIETAAEKKLPQVIPYGSLRGDLQVQTSWTDGSSSIEDMAAAARQMGLEYMAVTDHTKRLAMARGLDEKRIIEQMKEIDAVNKKMKGKFTVLKGSECDILKDGSLDLPDDILKRLDVVGVSIHSFFNLPQKEQTARALKAIRNPHADIFFHPTGRIINRREACDLDMDEVIKTAKKTGTVMEIDAYPDRSDLKDEYIRKCVAAGVKMAIDSDAHNPHHFNFLGHGIAQARRGWAEKKDIVNAWPLEKMKGFLKK